MTEQDDKKSGPKKWIMFGAFAGGCLLVLVAVGGVLAAIAIPSFIRYIKLSKVAEATSQTQSIALQAAAHWQNTDVVPCAFPPALPRTFDPTAHCGGEKAAAEPLAAEKWREAGIPMDEPRYFAYSTRVEEGEGGTTRYVIEAVTDFSCGGPMHTARVVVEGRARGECTAEVMPAEVEHELE